MFCSLFIRQGGSDAADFCELVAKGANAVLERVITFRGVTMKNPYMLFSDKPNCLGLAKTEQTCRASITVR